jgi:NAD(P)-dependent dehydrogenase (short-subunit alcohol dehydrogenase family)
MIGDVDIRAAQAAADACMTISAAGGGNTSFRAEAIHVDVTVEASVGHAVSMMTQSFGRIDYCVMSAGIGVEDAKDISEADAAEFSRFHNVNVLGALLVTRDVSATMRAQEPRLADPTRPERGTCRGSIVLMGSLASFIPQPGMVQYTSSKHAILGISRNAALDNAAFGVRVNCVCPSWVDTPMVQRATEKVSGLDKMIEALVPFGRMGRADEVADTVMFLCSPRSSYTTGCSLVVDGGTSLRGVA